MKRRYLLVCLVVIALLVVSCGGTTPTTTPATFAPTTAAQEASVTPKPAEKPAVGGTLVVALEGEPDTMDIHKTVSGDTEIIMKQVGASVLAIDPKTDQYVPYLAEKYSISEDGLTWEITFRKGIKWHDGTPFTAADYAYTMARVLTSESPATGAMTDGMASAEAVDDYTVRIHMDSPNSGMLFGLSTSYMQPVPKHYIEKVGEDEYARMPIGVGPFKFKEWATGDRIILERNPDFNWGPPYTHGGPVYISTLEFRIVPEYTTRVAGLESAEVDIAQVRTKDLDRVKATGKYDLYPFQFQGLGPYLLFNVSKPPFDDVLVRQAFNLAINRDELVKTVELGYGEQLWGVVTPATFGYWDGVRKIGYGFDLEKAKALMSEAGYKPNSSGILEKDGKALELDFIVNPSERGNFVKTAEILLEHFKALGVKLKLQQLEYGVWQDQLTNGEYTLTIDSWGWAEAAILFPVFHSSMAGMMNVGYVNDPALDDILMSVITATTQASLNEAVAKAQQALVEKAYVAPLFTITQHFAIAKRAQGMIFRAKGGEFEFFDTYLETTK